MQDTGSEFIEEISKHIQHDVGIEVKLYRFKENASATRAGRYGVRVRDMEAGENISCVICPTLEMAVGRFNKAVEDVARKPVLVEGGAA